MKYAVCSLLALLLGTSCSNGEGAGNGLPEQYRPVPAAAAACGLPAGAVATDAQRDSPINIVIKPEFDNASPQMAERKTCLRRWAAANGYVFLRHGPLGEE